jgi:transglutaminase-like putative cysteine protease
MYYSIRHLTKFRYSAPVSESLMEARMQPRSDDTQRCLSFQLKVLPRARVHSYRDYLGNIVHHFDVPGNHNELTLLGEALVDVQPPHEIPDSLGADAWAALDALIAGGDFIEMLMPSGFVQPSELLEQFARELGFPPPNEVRRHDPLALLLQVNATLNSAIAYVPKSTHVDSPIEDALRSRRGVCQDFAHIMITLVRGIGVPCRYVSGYLFRKAGDTTRSSEGATHAWVEAMLPELGWVGFDPTNHVLAGQRHIRTAVGRDYGDVPPTKGVFKGSVESQLLVKVSVSPSKAPPAFEPDLASAPDWSSAVREAAPEADALAQQQQQQQQ